MNFTGGNTLPNIARRNWQIVILTGGLALALSAGALTGAFEREGSPATTAVSRPVAASIEAPVPWTPSTTGSPELVYILVDSQADARIFESVISTEAANSEGFVGSQDTIVEVVALENQEQEAQFNDSLALSTAELMAANIGVEVVDLRETAAPALGLSTSDAEGAEATENIVYIVSSEAEKLKLEQQFHESSTHQTDLTQRSVIVISQGQADLYNTIVGEQLATGAFSLVDLR
jgi:hypothetical protein